MADARRAHGVVECQKAGIGHVLLPVQDGWFRGDPEDGFGAINVPVEDLHEEVCKLPDKILFTMRKPGSQEKTILPKCITVLSWVPGFLRVTTWKFMKVSFPPT